MWLKLIMQVIMRRMGDNKLMRVTIIVIILMMVLEM